MQFVINLDGYKTNADKYSHIVAEMGLGAPICADCMKIMDHDINRSGYKWFCDCGNDCGPENSYRTKDAFMLTKDERAIVQGNRDAIKFD